MDAGRPYHVSAAFHVRLPPVPFNLLSETLSESLGPASHGGSGSSLLTDHDSGLFSGDYRLTPQLLWEWSYVSRSNSPASKGQICTKERSSLLGEGRGMWKPSVGVSGRKVYGKRQGTEEEITTRGATMVGGDFRHIKMKGWKER